MNKKPQPRPGRAPLSIQVFLSHRYKSPAVNLYFFTLFAEDKTEVQFEVDEGTFATNVTRLERMLRGADGFIGIYPFPGTWEDAQSAEQLRKASRYFRLELDLAIRSRKPAVIFYDERYGDLLRPPPGILSKAFKHAEVAGSGGFPQAGAHRKVFAEFRKIIKARKAYDVARATADRSAVGIFVPQSPPLASGYKRHQMAVIEAALRDCGRDEIKKLPWPPVLDRHAFEMFNEVDWACVDLCDEMAATGIPSYLHGRFVPTIRLKKVHAAARAQKSALENFLYGAQEVGYPKDILAWRNVNSLEKGLRQRLSTITGGVRRISSVAEAESYFKAAALRKDAVFLSYSGRDDGVAARVSAELKKHFQTVFDYRDGKSIKPGQPWLKEIFDQLATSAVGIPLLSDNYLASGNCIHEAQEMVAHADSGKMKLIPVRLSGDKLNIPPWLKNIQHFALHSYGPDVERATRDIVGLIGESHDPAAAPPGLDARRRGAKS